MRSTLLILILLLKIKTVCHEFGLSAITYIPRENSRLGDHIIMCINTLRLSEEYNLFFLYQPFPYSDQLEIDRIMPHNHPIFEIEKILIRESQLINPEHVTNTSTVYKIDKVSLKKIKNESSIESYDRLFLYTLICPSFKKHICNLIKPIKSIKKIHLLTDSVSVDVHVRKGGGYDKISTKNNTELTNEECVDILFPLKFPSDEYYLEQMKKIITLFPKQKIYFFIFTDDPNPSKIVDLYKKNCRIAN